MAVQYKVIAKGGEYQKDGQTKTRYIDCGVVMDGRHGLVMKLDVIPAVFDGWFYFSEPRQKTDGSGNQAQAGRVATEMPDEDIPF